MRIAFFSWESLHSIPVGGIAVHVTELAAALQRRGHEVHVFTRIGPNQQIYECIDGVHYHRCPFNFHSDFIQEMHNMSKSMVHYFFETENYVGNFDIVHGHDWHVVSALDEIKKARNKKIVWTLHSTQFGRDGNYFHDGKANDIKNIEWYGTYIADRVIVCSQTMKSETQWVHRVPEWKIRVIHNGISSHKFNGFIDPWNDVKKRYGIGPLDPVATFIGRMTYQKGPDLFLEAIPDVLNSHPNAKFFFVGDGDMKGHLEHRARQLNVSHAVRFTGYVPEEEKIKILKASDCLVVPSRNEPFGIVVLEGWAAGKPVIATHGTGAGEIVWHEVTGLRVYQAPNSIAWGIKYIFSNFEKARWMGANGRKAAEEAFNWDRIAYYTEQVYKEILG
ncbi:MAG: glycosyltransferase family 4 protein [Candidatus Aenigmatarchaeota archaeon]